MASRSLAPVTRSRSRTPAFPALLDPFRLMNSLLTDVVSTRPGDGEGNDLLFAQPRMNIEDTGNEIRVTAELPGVSATRAHQVPAGAAVAAAAMRLLDVPFVRICPWALREGVILRRLDSLEGA